METQDTPQDTPQGTPQDTATDTEAIKQLKARYFRLMDTKQWDDFADVFCEDAVMDMSGELERAGVDGELGIVHGRTQIAEFVRGAVDAAITAHHGHMPEITFSSPTQASGIWAMFDFVDFGERVDLSASLDSGEAGKGETSDEMPAGDGVAFRGLKGYGHYHETYTKCDDNNWRIQTLKLTRLHIETF